jgi:hypothetical protein
MKTTISVFLLVLSGYLVAQNESPRYQYDQMIWIGYYNKIKVNEKWSVNSDFQFRTKDWYKTPSQALGRTGLVYNITERVNVTAGLAHFRFFLNDRLTRGEWRPWQEIGLLDGIGKLKITSRIRVEQRYNQKVADGVPINDYGFNWRFRYKLDLQLPVYKFVGRTIFVAGGNEVMVNAGPTVKFPFDQNRTYIGINYEHNTNFTFQFQFMYTWQQLANAYLDEITIARFNLIHTIKL